MKKCLLILVFLFFVCSLYSNEQNVKKRDIVLFVDVSNSMFPFFPEVKDYLINDFSKTINIGDKLLLFKFYGKTERIYNKKIESTVDIDAIKALFKILKANRPWTNIGNALDTAKDIIYNIKETDYRKCVLLISDSRQEVPKKEKYYSRDFSIKHELLEKAEILSKKHWKIHYLFVEKEQQKVAPVVQKAIVKPESKLMNWSWLWWILIVICIILIIYLILVILYYIFPFKFSGFLKLLQLPFPSLKFLNINLNTFKRCYNKELKRYSEHSETIKSIDKTKWDKISSETNGILRNEFNNKTFKNQLIKDWEAKNGKQWPTYKEDVYHNGKMIRKVGERYDVHHIKPLEFGGRNTSDNLTPLHASNHFDHQGIHNSEGYYNEMKNYFKGKVK